MVPIQDKVKNIKTTTIGGVAKFGDIIMQILTTNSDLVVEAKMSTVDIAYIKKGQDATVKLDAYDYSIFGTVS